MPPDNWCGYARRRSCGDGMPTIVNVCKARWRACSRDTLWCACTASIICVSTRSTGFSVIIGSWKIIAIS
ncbi:hypothetical protein D3C73_1383750 [compost metagenome]